MERPLRLTLTPRPHPHARHSRRHERERLVDSRSRSLNQCSPDSSHTHDTHAVGLATHIIHTRRDEYFCPFRERGRQHLVLAEDSHLWRGEPVGGFCGVREQRRSVYSTSERAQREHNLLRARAKNRTRTESCQPGCCPYSFCKVSHSRRAIW